VSDSSGVREVLVELATPRLLIRTLQPSDGEVYHCIVRDPLVMRFLGNGNPLPYNAVATYVEQCVTSEWQGSAGERCQGMWRRAPKESRSSPGLPEKRLYVCDEETPDDSLRCRH
jgi:hypothetical protein